MEEILNPNCSEVVWRLEVSKDTKRDILKGFGIRADREEKYVYDNYPNDCLRDMIEELSSAPNIDKADVVIIENNTFEYVSEYVEKCFEIAKRFKHSEITIVEARKLDKNVWDELIELEE